MNVGDIDKGRLGVQTLLLSFIFANATFVRSRNDNNLDDLVSIAPLQETSITSINPSTTMHD